MRILVDTLSCGREIYGVGRVLLEHLRRLAGPGSPARGMEFHLVVSEDNASLFDVPGTFPVRFPFALRRRGLSLPLQMLWERTVLPRVVRRLGIDAYLRPNLSWYHPLPCPQAVFIHDLAEWHPDGARQYPPGRLRYRRLAVAANARRADRLLTVSEHAAAEIGARFPEAAGRLAVIRNGAPEPAPRPGPPARGEGCFLSVGRQLLHKNHLTLARAYIRADRVSRLAHPLVLLGGEGNATAELRDLVGREGYADRILFRGYVSEEEKRGYYRRAVAFLFPTLYEGFGLPVLESMAQGIPVACSDAACLPEVAGKAALLLDPRDEAAWAGALADLDAGRVDVGALAAAGLENVRRFSWDASAAGLAAVLESLAGAKKVRSGAMAAEEKR